MLDGYTARCLVQSSVGLDEDLAGLLVCKDNVADLGAPEIEANRRHVNIEFVTSLDVRGGLVNVKLLQVLADGCVVVSLVFQFSLDNSRTFTSSSQNLRAIQLDGQIRQVSLLVVQLAEIVASLEETLEDGESGLAVSLSPLLALGIPHLERCKTSSGHREVGGIEHVTSLSINIDAAVSETKDLQNWELAAQVHGNKLSTALLVGSGNASKDGAPGLARLVPGGDGLVRNRADRRVLLVEVVGAWRCLLQKLAASVT